MPPLLFLQSLWMMYPVGWRESTKRQNAAPTCPVPVTITVTLPVDGHGDVNASLCPTPANHYAAVLDGGQTVETERRPSSLLRNYWQHNTAPV
ncbi:hypothetical protein AVEN_142623-1 [Araneus ventricosus]|uniref:Secreted protein n=1 Tax=Araneus ventricosus TaxID=182803 RepID=A0A4Y2G8C2_ARAVE|nr:hypothetical protein AVEN_142623-1 [Araneus ventricosus]